MRTTLRACLFALLVAVVSACGAPAHDPAAATQRFLAERSSGSATADVGGTRQVLGSITALNGPAITIATPLLGTVELRLTETTLIGRQVEVTPADIAAGMTITAVGTAEDAALLAERIQIGAGGLLGNTALQLGAAGADGAPSADVVPEPSAAGGLTLGGSVISGTVADVDGQTLRIRLADGSETTARLADSAVVTRQEEVPAGALQLEMFVVASGSMSADGLVAATIEILSPPPER